MRARSVVSHLAATAVWLVGALLMVGSTPLGAQGASAVDGGNTPIPMGTTKGEKYNRLVLRKVDTTSVLLPPETSKAAVASVRSVLPRVRFSPARDGGRPTCELLRMQVNFSPR